MKLELPWPPSINKYYSRGRNTVFLRKEVKEYFEAVYYLCYQQKIQKIKGDIFLTLFLFPPDERRRDIDNLKKAIYDSLQHAGVYNDDRQIKADCSYMCNPLKNGKVIAILDQFMLRDEYIKQKLLDYGVEP